MVTQPYSPPSYRHSYSPIPPPSHSLSVAITAQHMAHRDLRLENIYLAFDGHIRIADLGVREVMGVG